MNTYQVKQTEYKRPKPKNRLLVRSGEITCPWLAAATYSEADWQESQQAARAELDAIADGVVAYHSCALSAVMSRMASQNRGYSRG